MKRKIVKEEIYVSDKCGNWFYGLTLTQLKEDIKELEELGVTDIDIKLVYEYGEHDIEIEFFKEREETEEEEKQRLQREKIEEIEIKERELAILKKLQEKYGE